MDRGAARLDGWGKGHRFVALSFQIGFYLGIGLIDGFQLEFGGGALPGRLGKLVWMPAFDRFAVGSVNLLGRCLKIELQNLVSLNQLDKTPP